MLAAYQRSKGREENQKYGNIIELISHLAATYLADPANTTLLVSGPFGGYGRFAKFDNSNTKPLQLKLLTSSDAGYPGSMGKNWLEYVTWAKHLDAIDSLETDHSVCGADSPGFKKVADVASIDVFYFLKAEIQDAVELLDEQGLSKQQEKKYEKLRKIAQKVRASGILKQALATSIAECWGWMPKKVVTTYASIGEIPSIIDDLMESLKKEVTLPHLETEQRRAADSLFFVAVCEHFRNPGAVKYMRSCLDMLKEKELTFQDVFGENASCTLALTGGTARARDVFKGEIVLPASSEKESYDYLSEDSDSDPDSAIPTLKQKKYKK